MRIRALSTAVGVAVLTTAVAVAASPVSPAAAAPLTKVLVFSKTAGFRHSSIPNGIAAVQQLGAQNGFTVTATEDANQFNTANLGQYQAVIWMMTTGDVLNDTQQTAFQSYINSGGGYVGVHSAADTEYDWPFYGSLMGAYFSSHPAIQQAQVRIEDRTNPSVAHLPATWTRTDEWYNYRTNPRANVHVLANLNESSYSGGTMGGDHPITWCRTVGAGRAWYTGLGHTEASYTDPLFTRMLLGGIQIAAGSVTADCRPPTGTVTDLAQGRPATSSSVENASFPAGNAVDGNAGTRWSSAFADPQWISVDLGSTRQISRVRLNWEAAFGRAYQVQVSNDNTNWTTITSTSTGDGGVDDLTVSGSGRWVRVFGTQRGTPWGYSLWDLNVFGT
ncbi:MAG TPA: ThuA domain-containing protein [Mycobacteriales bacterium]|nr:ThuA domain-containing protein [Mycobacteriales bacterium]